MDFALLVARLLLAAVFAVAGVAKLADLSGSRRAARAFGVPPGLADVVGVALPIAELVVAVLLIPVATARWGAVAALALLLVFLAAMANQLRRGQHPDCHCFGQLHSAPLGAATVVRNGLLAAVALFIAVAGWNDAGASAVAWLGGASAVEIVALVASLLGLAGVAASLWLVYHLMGQNVRLADRLDSFEAAVAGGDLSALRASADEDDDEDDDDAPGLAIGAPAPAFALQGLFGETLTLDALRSGGQPTLLVFSDPGCGPCNALMPDIGRWQREHADALTVALVSRGGASANKPKATEHGLTNVMLQQDREIGRAYGSDATPVGVIVNADGTIGSRLALGADSIRALAARALAGRIKARTIPLAPVGAAANGPARAIEQPAAPVAPAAAPVGQPAPAVDLRDLRGRPVKLSSFRGKPTLLLFWDLNTPLSMDMLPDIRALDAAPPPSAPRLVVVSSGPPAAARAMRLKARIINDPDARVTNAFGATGTPAAVLLDAEGRIASDVTYGARYILALARGLDVANPPADGIERVGREAPGLELATIDGQAVRMADFRGKPTLVVQWSTTCGFCDRMLPDLRALANDPPDGAPGLVVIARGDEDAVRAMDLNVPVIHDTDNRGMRAFRAYSTPSAVLIDADGTVASPIAVGADEVLRIARSTTDEERAAAVAAIGTPAADAPRPAPASRSGQAAPSFTLPDLGGGKVSLESYRGEPTMVLFWNPECGFCQRMLDDLKEWEEDPDDDAPRLLVVSTGSVQQNLAQGLRSTVVLDTDFSVGAAFGATGTPSAVLVDAEGRIASGVAAGGRAVLALADGEEIDPSVPTSVEDPVVGLRIGSAMPDLVLPDLEGTPVDFATFTGERTMVLFWDLDCGFCARFLPNLKALEANPPAGAPRIVVVGSGEPDELRALGLSSLVLRNEDDAGHKAFNSWSTPAAIMIDADGTIASVPAEGEPAVVALLKGEDPVEATRRSYEEEQPKPLEIGTPAPDLALPDLDGKTVTLASLLGAPTVAVFWNPDCGYCDRMKDDLLEWEEERSPGAPRLVILSRGDKEANRSFGFESPLLLDDEYQAMAAFRTSGTPTAQLIDADGRIASGLVVGADAIFELLESATFATAPKPSGRTGLLNLVRPGGRAGRS